MLKFGHIFLAPEDGGAAGAGEGAAGGNASGSDASLLGGNPAAGGAQAPASKSADPAAAAGSVSRETPPVDPAKGAQELSLRAQLASRVKPEHKDAYEKWAGRFTEDDTFFEGLLEARAAASKRPAIPDEKATPEDRHNFFKQLGKPEKAEEYKLSDEGYDDLAKARLGEYKNFAHELDLTQAQAEKLKSWYDGQDKAASEAMLAQMRTVKAETEKQLKQKWGPDYEANLALASEAGGHFFKTQAEMDAFSAFLRMPLVGGGVPGSHPLLINMLAQVGRALAEDQTIAKFNDPGMTNDLQAQIDSITQEALAAKKMPFESPYHERLEPLYKKLHGSKPLNHNAW